MLVSAKEYLDYVEKTREVDMMNLARSTQNTLTNALGKLEETLYHTNIRRCKKLEPVYKMFERRVLEALINVGELLHQALLNSKCYLSPELPSIIIFRWF